MSPVVFGPAARELFDLSAPTAVEAGAGSGKTTCLVELAVRLLSGEATGEPLEPGEVVAITFTEKAAEELAERLREAVAGRVHAAAGTAGARAWLGRLAGLDRLFAGTIHAFAGALLREHALEAGLDPGFTQLDEEAAAAWRLEAARGAVVAALDAGRTAAAELASVHGAGGARAGLTELVAELCRERAARGVSGPWALPPDRTAGALEARARLGEAARALLAARGEARTAGGRALLEATGAAWAALGPGDLEGPLSRPARARLLALGEAARGRLSRADGERLPAARAALAEAALAFGPLAAEALGRAQAAELGRLAAEAEAGFAARKREARAQDFDDLLLGARDLLARDPVLLAELRGRVRALLVDEVQDVNPLQQEIADLLTGPASAALPGPPALLVAVGDPKQSIYRFRGADVAVFRRLAARLGAGGEGRLLRLQDNHRSSPAVLEVVNTVSALALQPPSLPARPYELSFGEEDRLCPVRAGGQAPACELLDDPQEGNAGERRVREAAAVAARIGALVSGAAGLWLPGEDGLRRPGYGDLALLFRRLTQVGEYERALRRAGIPCRLVRGGGFYRAPEVRDLGELLASLCDPADALAWAALLRSPLGGLTDGALAVLAREGLPALARKEAAAAGRELEGALGELGGAPDGAGAAVQGTRLARLLSTWGELRALRDRLHSHELLALAAERLDLEAALLAAPDGERRRDNLRKALALARRHDAAGGTPPELARRLRSLARQPPREPEADLPPGDAVAMLTVHQAKGLEWPVVFLPDLGAGARSDGRRALLDGEGRLCAGLADPAREEHAPGASLQAARAEAAREAVAESRRLLYVALTRARDYLVLSGSGGRESWRRVLDEALAARPELAARVPFAEAGRFAVGGAAEATAAGPAQEVPPGVAPPRLCPPPPRPALRAAVTDLAEWARCPTRHHLARRLRLPERPALPAVGDDDPERATARGTLAHAMLAEVDLAAPPLERRAQLTACIQRLGFDPAERGPRRILSDVTRFLESPPGRWLAGRARQGALRREVPFLLRLDEAGGPACYLVGALDALAEEEGGGLHVLDFKYALPRRDAPDRYRLQLAAYALAVRRAHPGRRVRASLQFLRGTCPAVEVTPGEEELARFAALAPRLAEALHGDGGEVAPAAMGRTRQRCEAEGCGYVVRCYRAPHPQAFP